MIWIAVVGPGAWFGMWRHGFTLIPIKNTLFHPLLESNVCFVNCPLEVVIALNMFTSVVWKRFWGV